MEIRTSEDVDAAIRLFVQHPGGNVSMVDGMISLFCELHIRRAQQQDVDRLYRAVSRVTSEHVSAVMIVARNDWQRARARLGQIDDMRWFHFATLDVEHFFVVIRALFDHVAEVCTAAAVQPGQCPTSFNDLLRWCQTEARAARILGPEIAQIVNACGWFESLRNTRDGIVHSGALTLAFPTAETVSFNIRAGARSMVVPAQLWNNENIADFELYMAWALGNVGIMLDRLGTHLLQRYGDNDLRGRSSWIGYAELLGYLRRLKARLREHEIAA